MVQLYIYFIANTYFRVMSKCEMSPTAVSYIPGSLGTVEAVLGASLAVLVLAGEIVGSAWI